VSIGELWLDAVGRFHPVVLHFPLALGTAAALVECVAWMRGRKAPSPTAFALVWLAAVSGPVAVVTGILLARGESDEGDTIEWHRWTAIAAGVLLLAAAILATALRHRTSIHSRHREDPANDGAASRSAQEARRHQVNKALPASVLAMSYRATLLAAACVVGWSGHLGGEMKWGDGFTTKRLFEAIRQTLAGGSTRGEQVVAGGAGSVRDGDASRMPHQAVEPPFPRADPGAPGAKSAAPIDVVLYDPHVRELFVVHCSECHMGGRRKGRLSLASTEFIDRESETGWRIVARGSPESSELLRRIRLPAGDEFAMPPDGPRLPAEQIELVRRWIEAGAP